MRIMKQLKKSVLFALGIGSNLDNPTAPSLEFVYDQLYALMPYEPVSVRGAVMGLKEERLVTSYQRSGQTLITLTSQGRELLRQIFPAFRVTDVKRDITWTVCVFLSDSKRAVDFRATRQELLLTGFFPLERGVYVLPRPLPEALKIRLTKLKTFSQVLIFESRKLAVGDERQIIRTLYDVDSYNKKGKSILETLDIIDMRLAENKQLHPQTKVSFINIVQKLMDFLSEDLQILERYFPQEVRVAEIKEAYLRVGEKLLPQLLPHK